MNLEGQNLESLRKMIRNLQEENQELKKLLKKSNITFKWIKRRNDNEGNCRLNHEYGMVIVKMILTVLMHSSLKMKIEIIWLFLISRSA